MDNIKANKSTFQKLYDKYVIGNNTRTKSNFSEFGKKVGLLIPKQILIAVIIALFKCGFDNYNNNDYPTEPYNINPGNYVESVFGITKSSSNTNVSSKLVQFLIRASSLIFMFVSSLIGVNSNQILGEFPDTRYDNPFTLANVYSWAYINKTVSYLYKYLSKTFKLYTTVKTHIKTVQQGVSLLSDVYAAALYPIFVYFMYSVLSTLFMVFSAVSIFGMVKGLGKHKNSSVPGYGMMYYLMYIGLLILSFVIVPFTPGLYVVIVQIASIAGYFLWNKKLRNTENKISFVLPYMNKIVKGLIISILVGVYNISKKTLITKHINYVVYSLISVICIIFTGTVIKKFFTKPTSKAG